MSWSRMVSLKRLVSTLLTALSALPHHLNSQAGVGIQDQGVGAADRGGWDYGQRTTMSLTVAVMCILVRRTY